MDVVVIGAGLSGLTAALTAQEAGRGVLVLEAGTHIGGRISALRDPDSGRAIADLGPTWVWPKYQPVVARWLEKLDVATFEQFNQGDAVLLGYGSTPHRQPLPGQDGMVRIVGGPTTLIDTLAERVGAANIRTASPVVEILEDGSKRVTLRLSSGEIINADKVIVSVPLRVAATSIKMPWAPQRLIDAMKATPTWMSSHAKAVVVYKRPFWRDAGLSGRIASRLGPLVEVHDHTCAENAPASLFGFVGWSPEQRRIDPNGLKKAILTQLSEGFGEMAENPESLKIQDWATNPRIVTDLDISQPADHPNIAPGLLRQPVLDGRVRFAVSETSDVSPGLIEGALASGERAGSGLL